MTDPTAVQAVDTSAQVADDGLIAVPSGQKVTLQDVIWNEPGPDGLAVRFRFIAPQIARHGGTVDFETASADMLHLCQDYALQRIAESGPRPTQVIISMSDVEVAFGDTAPEATQLFEAYSFEGDACIWDVY